MLIPPPPPKKVVILSYIKEANETRNYLFSLHEKFRNKEWVEAVEKEENVIRNNIRELANL